MTRTINEEASSETAEAPPHEERAAGEMLCEASVIHVGGSTAPAEGRIVDREGRLYAHGTATCMLFRS